MIIGGNEYQFVDIIETMSIPDCGVVPKNKLKATTGHGEAKFYIAPKVIMRDFYGGEGFTANCFVLKDDLIKYMKVMENEYKKPSQEYRQNDIMPSLYDERLSKLSSIQEEQLWFTIKDQVQIDGARGYVNSSDYGYKWIREVCLPVISSVCAMKLQDENGNFVYYWKPFPDWNALNNKRRTAYAVYGKKKQAEEDIDDTEDVDYPKNSEEEIPQRGRKGQAKYREELMEQCQMCPFTYITDIHLLVASHIKPWAVSNEKEKIDPYNGYMLSPLYDRLFDKGYITFTNDQRILISNWISQENWDKMKKYCGLDTSKTYPFLLMDDKRKEYLEYHRNYVFRG